MYQPTTKKLENLFDDEDEEIGNKDLFKSNNKNVYLNCIEELIS